MTGVPPVKASAFSFDVTLVDSANRPYFRITPTLAVGDVTVSKDGAAFNNIAALPTANGYQVRVSLSATEMNADRVSVLFHDVAGNEWDDLLMEIYTDTVSTGGIAQAVGLMHRVL